ncbi:MAG: hypothetical protein Q8K51_09535 [Nitrospirota bacterium]|nr:hypothetical protein [Nitrospirota bacterium]
MKKVCDRHVDDPQQSISALQKENIKLQEENAKLIFEKRNLTLDLKQNKINLTKSEIKYKEMKMKCAEKIRALEDEIINIKKSRPTVGELMSNIGRGIVPEE